MERGAAWALEYGCFSGLPFQEVLLQSRKKKERKKEVSTLRKGREAYVPLRYSAARTEKVS